MLIVNLVYHESVLILEDHLGDIPTYIRTVWYSMECETNSQGRGEGASGGSKTCGPWLYGPINNNSHSNCYRNGMLTYTIHETERRCADYTFSLGIVYTQAKFVLHSAHCWGAA